MNTSKNNNTLNIQTEEFKSNTSTVSNFQKEMLNLYKFRLNISKLILAIFTLTFFSCTSKVNSQKVTSESQLYNNKVLDCVERLTRSLNNYTLVLDTYDEISLLQLFLYNEDITKTKECLDSGENWLEFNSINLNSKISSNNNNSTFKTLKNSEYLLIIAEFNKEMLNNCTHYETFYLAATDCRVDLNFIINNKQVKKSIFIRFIKKISNTKIPLETSSFLYAYEYDHKETNIETDAYESNSNISDNKSNYEVVISPLKFSNFTNFIKCDTIECLQNIGIFGNYDFKTVYFKITNEVEIDLMYNIKLEKVIMVVNNDQDNNANNLEFIDSNENDNEEFLSNNLVNSKVTGNNISNNNRTHAVFFKDITHLVEQVKNFYALKLKFYPEKFNLILTFSLKNTNPSKTEEKMMYRVNDFTPFSKLTLLSTVSPNFRILLYTVAAILFLILSAMLLVCLKCICRK